MYRVEMCDVSILKELETKGYMHTVFTTFSWISFLEKNQGGEPIVFELWSGNDICAYFVGLIIKKAGIKILGSPFEGWITPDMGFIRINVIDVNAAAQAIKKYAFSQLGCFFVQIEDKKISIDDCARNTKKSKSKLLYIDNSLSLDEILNRFTKNGRRDVRASARKGLSFEQVAFDSNFVKEYYAQLVDVFAKQDLKPFYSIDKIYDLVEAFKDKPQQVLALEAKLEGRCVATVLSVGHGEWAYYLGAASYREYQKYLPNEGLFWEFVKYWNKQGIKNIDLVGYRDYKMKYNPEIIDCPIIYFEKIPGLLCAKNTAKWFVTKIRTIKGYFAKKWRHKES